VLFHRHQSERHSDKEATFESADLDEIPDNSELRLAPDNCPQMAAAKREDMPRTCSYLSAR
jgi:hypothetical protein